MSGRRRVSLMRGAAVLAVIVVCGGLGTYLLRASHAATAVVASEAEGGTLGTNASRVTDATAASGAAVRFNAASTSSWKHLSTQTQGWAWQWQLSGTVNETVLDSVSNPNKLYDIDAEAADSGLVSRLHAKNIYVVCYVESGDFNDVRDDAGDFATSILGKKISGFPDEKYINITQLDGAAGPTGKTLRQIMTARFQAAKNKGCDGIEPDLDDLWTYTTAELGFSISRAQQVTYNSFLIQMGHGMGMAVGLKNGADPDGSFDSDMYNAGADFVLNEECNQYSECGGYKVFVQGGRPVFQVEYLDNQGIAYSGTGGTCAMDVAAGFDGIVKDSSSTLAALPRTACRSGN